MQFVLWDLGVLKIDKHAQTIARGKLHTKIVVILIRAELPILLFQIL